MRAARFHLPLLLIGLLGWAGCAAHGGAAPLSDTSYTALPDDAPVIVTTGELDGSYEELAILVVKPGGLLLGASYATLIERMNANLRDEARAIGAHAVVRVEYDIADLEGETTRATGTAVRMGTP